MSIPQNTGIDGGLLWDIIPSGKSPGREWEAFADGLNDIISSVRKDYTAISQFGAKTGQTYFEHAVKGVQAAIQIFSFADIEPFLKDDHSMQLVKMTCTAYLVHDLNKLPWFHPWTKDKWHVDTLRSELERINKTGNVIDVFLPGWNELLDDMMILINAHSKVYANRGNELNIPSDVNEDGNSFSKHELTIGIDIMRLVDTLDLVHHPSRTAFTMDAIDMETKKEKKITIEHEKFFTWMRELLSKIAGEQMEMNTVIVIKEASSFTNVIMNKGIDVLEKRGIHALRVFTTGAIVFGTVATFNQFYDGKKLKKDVMEELVKEIGDAFVQSIDDIMLRPEKIVNLFDYSSAGIKIADFAFQEPNAKEKTTKVIDYLARTITPLKLIDGKKKPRYERVVKLGEYLDDNVKMHPLIARWESGMNDDLMNDEDAWKMGRLAQTVFIAIPYIFNTWNEANVNQVELMKEMLERLGIFTILEPVYDKPESASVVYRYYFIDNIVGAALKEAGKTMQDIVSPLVEWLHEKMDDVQIDEPFINDPADFIHDHVQIFTEPASSTDLLHPSDPSSMITCSACGKKMDDLGSKKKNEKAYKWKSQQVIDGVPVEKFSNFLPAGMNGKGVRMICHSCMWRNYLESILTTVSGKGIDSWYTTFYMEDGLPHDSIVSMKNLMTTLRNNENGDTSFRVVPSSMDIPSVSLKTQKGFGFMVPSIPDETCGSLTLTWKMKKSPVKEQFWDVMRDVLVLSMKTRMRCIVTMLRNDYEDIAGESHDVVFQDIPGSFKKLIGGKNWITFDQAPVVFEILNRISKVSSDIIKKIDELQAMNVKVLDAIVDRGIIAAIHVIEHGWNDDKKKKNSIARARYLEEVRAIHDLHLSLRSELP